MERYISNVARRYGKAMFDLAREANSLEGLVRDMNLLLQLFLRMPDLEKLFRNRYIGKQKRMAMAGAVFKNVGLSDLSIRSILFIIEKNRPEFVLQVVAYAKSLALECLGIQAIALTVSGEVDVDLLKCEIEKRMKNSLNAKVICDVAIDPSLIGGFTLEHRDRVYDASVKGMLGAMKAEMIGQG